ncbi:arylacetamide deacetylase isoform X3 [Latimeria chalumnae]|uniref:arylacetamide deacetylase isoform X3 n=1 Tax=Latimeria chalumnae TaxID=7897 RepID=UPI00313E897A
MASKLFYLMTLTVLLAYYIYTPIPEQIEQRWKLMVTDAFFRSLGRLAELAELLGLKHYMEVMMLLTDAEQVGPSSNENVTVTDTTFNDVPVRLYIPRKETKELRRAIIYIHGGGWCLGSAKMEPYDIMSRRTASEVNAVVVSVEYRLAPEYHFPVQFDDVYAVVKYFLQDEVLAMYSVDAARIGVSGDSAGGNLAAAVAQQILTETTKNFLTGGKLPPTFPTTSHFRGSTSDCQDLPSLLHPAFILQLVADTEG